MSEASPEIRRDMATVIDDLDFFPDLSVVEHLDLLARAHGHQDPDALVDEVLEEVQLVPQSGQLPGTLSSGQRRRLALATAFVRPRKLLVMDEPEQRLDTEGVAWLAEPAQVRAAVRARDRLRQPRAGPGREGRHPGGRHGRREAVSALDQGKGDDPLEPPMTAARTAGADPGVPARAEGNDQGLAPGPGHRNLMEAFTDAYVAVIGALMVGAMVVNVVLRAQRNVAACDAASCLSARAVLPWAAFAAAVAVALTASRLFGPVLASAAEGFWLLDAPISRAKLLSSRLVAALAIALVGGAVMGALVSALTGSALPEVAVWAAATGLSAAARRGVRRRSAGGGAAPADPRDDVRLRPARAGRPGGRGRSVGGWFTLGLSDSLGLELGVIVSAFALAVLAVSACWPSGGWAGSGAPG